MWDQGNKRTGPYLRGHTDWSMIELGLDLLGRNGVMPDKVNIGFGFYGRSFTMRDPGCFQPNGGIPGSCSRTKGVLTYEEVVSRINSLDVKTFYECEATAVWQQPVGVVRRRRVVPAQAAAPGVAVPGRADDLGHRPGHGRFQGVWRAHRRLHVPGFPGARRRLGREAVRPV
jgi:hypothetical protein